MRYPEIEHVKNNPELTGMAEVLPEVVFSRRENLELAMTVIAPWRPKGENVPVPRRPLIVFVQGSSWTTPRRGVELPQLSRFAQMGYVVATVSHRDSTEGYAFPEYLKDVKCAIRFLRANADEYGVDPTRVAIWGTSSGGNAALLAGLTGDAPHFKTEEYAAFSDTVQVVVECFGPANLPKMIFPEEYAPGSREEAIFTGLMGGRDIQTTLKQMSPVNYVIPGEAYPPFLILQGDADPIVPYEQSLEMFHTLVDAGVDARMICVDGAPHEGNFWSWALLEKIQAFLREKL